MGAASAFKRGTVITLRNIWSLKPRMPGRELNRRSSRARRLLELPIELHTQFFKTSDQTARLAVLAHLNLKLFKFQKVEGRNGNEVTLVYVYSIAMETTRRD